MEIKTIVDTFKEEFEKRKINSPKGTIQEAHIDARGQNISEDSIELMKKDLKKTGYEVVEFHK